MLPFLIDSSKHISWWMDKKRNGVKDAYDSEKEMVEYLCSLPSKPILADHWMPLGYVIYTDFEKKLSVIDYNSVNTLPSSAYLLLHKLLLAPKPLPGQTIECPSFH
jgi:hypothetical protein